MVPISQKETRILALRSLTTDSPKAPFPLPFFPLRPRKTPFKPCSRMRYLDLMALRFLLTHTNPLIHRLCTFESQGGHQPLDRSISLHLHQWGRASLEVGSPLLMRTYSAHRRRYLSINILPHGTICCHPRVPMVHSLRHSRRSYPPHSTHRPLPRPSMR